MIKLHDDIRVHRLTEGDNAQVIDPNGKIVNVAEIDLVCKKIDLNGFIKDNIDRALAAAGLKNRYDRVIVTTRDNLNPRFIGVTDEGVEMYCTTISITISPELERKSNAVVQYLFDYAERRGIGLKELRDFDSFSKDDFDEFMSMIDTR